MEHASAEACATVLKSQGLMQSFGKAMASCETWQLMIFMVIFYGDFMVISQLMMIFIYFHDDFVSVSW